MPYDAQAMKEVREEQLAHLRVIVTTAIANLRHGTHPEGVARALEAALQRADQIAGENAAPIELHEYSIDFRDYLEGRTIANGQQLHLWTDGRWVPVRYELANYLQRKVMLYGTAQQWTLDRQGMRFRWPPRE